MDTVNVSELWVAATQMIRLEISDLSYSTWITVLRPILVRGNQLLLEAPNAFTQQILLERYQNLIAGAVSQAAGQPLGVSFVLPQEAEAIKPTVTSVSGRNKVASGPMLNPKYTFSTFVTGNSNRFAHAASLAVAENPADAYNPLFIYGGVGLGKTHLMHAIGHHVLTQNPNSKLLYISSETFTNELINAISTNKNNEFRTRFRNVDVLMVDDIQFIAGKEQTQEEFFHTFNTLHEANKQIIISSDKQPKEIPTLEDRLRSRFEWGLIADIQRPDLETRVAILQKKADLESLDVQEEVNMFIASKVESNIRELEGCLTRVVAYASLVGKPITLSVAEEALRDMLPIRDPKHISPDMVMSVVGEYYNVSRADLIGQKRNREVTLPRQIAMYLLREVVEFSFPQIGHIFGGRDHTTVLHACNKIIKDSKDDPRMRVAIEDLKKRLLEA